MVAGLTLRAAVHERGEGGGGDGGGGEGGGEGDGGGEDGGGRINATEAYFQQMSFRPDSSAEEMLALSVGPEGPHDTEGSRSQPAVTMV